MKTKFTVYFIIFSLLALCASVWQAYEASTLDERLLQIDEQTQETRLLELSLQHIVPKAEALLTAEAAKQSDTPDFNNAVYPQPGGTACAAFNKGFFLLSPAALLLPAESEPLRAGLMRDELHNTLVRKADNPDAPLWNPHEKQRPLREGARPVFGVYLIKDTDFSHPIRQDDKPGPYFAWAYRGDIYYMRSISTSHGNALQGFVVDVPALAQQLLPLAEPGLRGLRMEAAEGRRRGNVGSLPLSLQAEGVLSLPDTAARRSAIHGTVVSAWFISVISIIIVFSILAFYARLERRRSDFVSAVTHELRTPLTSFSLYTEMLCRGQVPPERLQEYYGTLHKECQRLGHLVENVLAFARLSRGKVRGRKDSGPCAELLNGVFERVAARPRAEGVNVSITHDSHTKLLSLRTDLLSVEQILTNLADNSLKYNTNRNPTLGFSVMQMPRTVAIRVIDNGTGMSEEARRNLFRPFSRSAEARRGCKPGVGLGLALSRDIARSIGGELVLEKSDERGTTFLLTLPLGE